MEKHLNLPTINALWIGGQLGQISRACLTSFVMRGHQVNLYTYDDLPDIPNSVNVCDGNDIIHHSKIFKHKKKQSYAPFSDIFSYELLKQTDNAIYVDCDVYCLKPITIPSHGYLFGYEDTDSLNVAILALPKNSELLQALCNIKKNPDFIPEWYPPFRKFRLHIKRLFHQSKDISEMPWGITGPSALTFYAKHYDKAHHAQPIDVLYPIQYSTVNRLLEQNLYIEDITTKNSLCVHLYNEVLRSIDLTKISPNCILSQMLKNQL